MSQTRALRLVRHLAFGLVILSAGIWITTTICFFGVWDHVAAITTFPQWSWAIIGILTAGIASRILRPRAQMPLLLLGLWPIATLYFSDNLVPIIRGIGHGSVPSNRAPQGTFRVVTLNCASSTSAAGEVMQFQPDVVLLQEIPASNKVAELAREWFADSASFVIGLDSAIISRYPLRTIEERPGVHSTQAILGLPQAREMLVTSLRLPPPLGRIDLWNPTAWRAYMEDRRQRRRELRSVLDGKSAKLDLPEVIGGDFNAPAGDAIYKLLAGYHDSHRTAGRGWGNTALNTIPAFRPDQIWLKGLPAVSSHGVRTVHSDHRMVVTDVLLGERK